MARLPTAQNLGGAPNLRPQRDIQGYRVPNLPSTGESVVAKATEGLGDTLFKAGADLKAGYDRQQKLEEIARKEAETKRNTLELTAAEAGFTAASTNTLSAAADDQDYATLPTRTAETLTKARSELASTITDPYTRQLFEAKTQDNFAKANATVAAHARAKWRDASRASLTETLGGLTDSFVMGDSDETARNAKALIFAGVNAGHFTAQEGGTMLKTFLENGAEARLKFVESRDPAEAKRLIEQRMGTPKPAQAEGADINAAVADATSRHNLPPGFLAKLVMLESSGNPAAVSKTGAAGPAQFTEATAKEYGLTDRADIPASVDAAARYAVDNIPRLRKALGRDPEPWEVYFAHQQGAAGAAKLLTNPDAKVSALNLGRAVADNGGRADMTAGEFTAMWRDRYATAPTTLPGGRPAQVASAEPAEPQKTGTWLDLIPATKLPGLQRDAETQIRQREDRRRVDADRARAAAVADLDVMVERGQASYSDLDRARAGGLLDDSQWSAYTKRLDTQNAKQQKLAADMSRVTAALNGGAPLDFRDADTKKALDAHYDAVAQQWKDLPPDQIIERSLAYSTRAGMLPKQVQGFIRGNLRGDDPQRAVMASDAVARLRNANPQLLNDLSDEDLRLANMIASYTEAGVKPTEAAKRAMDAMAVPPAVKKAREEEYDALVGKDAATRAAAQTRWIEGRKNSIFSSDPNMNPQMRAEFDRVTRDEFQRTGDLEASRVFALDQIDRVWGRTEVGGGQRYMKLAPEKFYGVGGLTDSENSAWMTEQLLFDLRNGALQDPNNPINPISKDNVRISLDPRHGGERPLYLVSIKGPDGIWHEQRTPHGRPMAWRPDWETSAGKAAKDAALKSRIDAAIAQRRGAQTLAIGAP